MVLWSIWKNRNSQLWEDKKQRPIEAAMLSLGWYNDFKKANGSEATQQRQVMHWTKPEQGWFKCNSDGAYIASSRRGGCGMVIRDERGDFVAAAVKPCLQLTLPFHAELMALLEGMKLAETLNYCKVIFETDCLLLVHALTQSAADLSSLGLILNEVKEIMSRHPEFRLIHAQREANRVAHVLANHAQTSCESQSWFVFAPEMIRDAILNDCNR
ncbi:uncharacterized protein LOC112178232 [Rosa chinensis]|uniref:uncharacterized protein LOC112178232 n=1 Tax=Rosa chinensis TaxID=74649 RepID=UPI000D08AA4B|nr:uncharacterized protein LOC112178232 [Rosa chinensis]